MTDFSPFLCQPSTSQGSGQQQVYTPNIPDFYFDPETAVAFGTSPEFNLTTTIFNTFNTFVYTLPPESALRNCTGTVTAIEYCYLASQLDTSSMEIFELHILTRDGSLFQIERSISIWSTPTSSICHPASLFDMVCCDTTTLNGGGTFHLPPSNFSFGVTAEFTQLLIFTDSAVEYNVQHFEVQLPLFSSIFAVSVRDSLSFESLLLMRFHAGKVELMTD